jgi:hypothetical protein
MKNHGDRTNPTAGSGCVRFFPLCNVDDTPKPQGCFCSRVVAHLHADGADTRFKVESNH